MSTSESEKEPSMEEILASIRRIISEDEATEPPKDKAEDAESTEESEAEVLVLTEVIEEEPDDSEAEAESPEEEFEPAPQPEPEPEAELDMSDKHDEALAEAEEQHEEAEPESAGEAVLDLVDDTDGQEDESAGGTMAEAVDEALVSAQAAAAAVSALSEVPRAVAATRPVDQSMVIGGQKTLEAVVRDAMAPHLKAWLDENLPSLVERVVQEEVRRMVRRAEDN